MGRMRTDLWPFSACVLLSGEVTEIFSLKKFAEGGTMVQKFLFHLPQQEKNG